MGELKLYAHTGKAADKSDWEPLADHLTAVAERAAGFAQAFGAADWARFQGLCHDLGKAKPAFQKRLEGGPSVSHASEGAAYALNLGSSHRRDPSGVILAYGIAGHHVGLPDYDGGASGRSVSIAPVWDAGNSRPISPR